MPTTVEQMWRACSYVRREHMLIAAGLAAGSARSYALRQWHTLPSIIKEKLQKEFDESDGREEASA